MWPNKNKNKNAVFVEVISPTKWRDNKKSTMNLHLNIQLSLHYSKFNQEKLI